MERIAQKFDFRQRMNTNDFEVFHYIDNEPKTVTLHNHDFYEIYLLLQGNISYSVEGTTYNLRRGDMLLIPPFKFHQPHPNSNSTYERMVIWIDKNYLLSISTEVNLAECFICEDNNTVNCLHSETFLRGRIAELLTLLNKEKNKNSFGNHTYAAGVLTQLLVELNRAAKGIHNSASSKKPTDLVGRVASFINENYSENLSLEFVAKNFFISKYYLSHEFSQQTGISISKYISLKRLSFAEEQLSAGVPANEVCQNCGFNNYATFYRTFKSKYGISPSQYSAQNK